MALQLWETLKESIVAFTGLCQATFSIVLALWLTIYYVVSGLFGSLSDHHQRPRDYQEQMQPLPPPVQLVETSEDELKQYDGTDPKKSLLMANKGQIYDVSRSRRTYDVFLSFRGPDVCNNFVGHLYIALDQRGINTYFDRERLKKGEQISAALMKAIEDSRIAIVVFSENYASSTWCLDELAKIMECEKQRGLIVFPVFYKMEPREVRTPIDGQSYAEALAQHKDQFKKDPEKVEKWKQALYDAGNLSGQPIPENAEEWQLIQDIVRDISIRLNRTALDLATYPVGIDSQVQVLKRILNLQSEDKVLMVGLWGKGGVGKTTLAKAIYNAVFREFQGSSFLERVRENSADLVRLQEKLLSEVLLGEKLAIYNVGGGSRLIQDRLCNKKVLIILDDVDNICQLDALARCCEWFGKGSRIIITTRKSYLLTSRDVDWNHIYKVKALENGEALRLFRKYAFQGNKKIEISNDLVDRVVHYAKGLPLALKVLGSSLCKRGEKEWKSMLQKLDKSPCKDINDVLKVSFDGLDDEEKEIFLDIACFFKGQSTKHITKVLKKCNFAGVSIGVKSLIEQSLISEEKGTLQMHDLIQLMGMNIVKEECHDNPGKRSRLWLWEDFLRILSRNAETDTIKAIVLKRPKREEIYIGPDTFRHMRNLRLLILLNVDNSFQGHIHLPDELRHVEWPHCTSFPEFSDGPKNLVHLDMRNSKIKGLEQFKDFRMLKDVNFQNCEFLTCVPDVSSAPNLKRLNLFECKSLVEVHQSVGCLEKLKVLNLNGCTNLSIFPSTLKTKSLHELNLDGCRKLKKFPDILAKIEHLRWLSLEGTAIEELPSSIDNLVSVIGIILTGCENLVMLPSSIYKLQDLKLLTLTDCSKFAIFPMNLEESTDPHGSLGFPSLTVLELKGCNQLDLEFLKDSSRFPRLWRLDLSLIKFAHKPTDISKCDNLTFLSFSGCEQLQEIPRLPPKIRHIEANYCRSLTKLPNFSGLSNFYSVYFASCPRLFREEFNLPGVSILEYFRKTRNTTVHILLIGGKMPEWIHHCEEGSISFKVPKDLYDKFLGIAFCVVLGLEKGKAVDVGITYQIYANGQGVSRGSSGTYRLESDHVWLEFISRTFMSEGEMLLQKDWSHFRVCLSVSNASIKKRGFRLICQQQEDDLKVELQPPQPIDWWPYERDTEDEYILANFQPYEPSDRGSYESDSENHNFKSDSEEHNFESDTEEEAEEHNFESDTEEEDSPVELQPHEPIDPGSLFSDIVKLIFEKDSKEHNFIDIKEEHSPIETDEEES